MVNSLSKNVKKEQIRISRIDELKNILNREGYNINTNSEEKFKEEIADIFEVNISVIHEIYTYIQYNNIIYRANNAKDFIDYIEKIILFENEHKELCEKISKIKKLIIDRVEYERERCSQDINQIIISDIEDVRKNIFTIITEEEKIKLENLDKEIEEHYLYAKDIELLKKMILTRKEDIEVSYNDDTKIKTISIEIPKEINSNYIPVEKGSVEYHQHLSSNIPRIQRLRRNLDKYMDSLEGEEGIFKIDQSKTLQDSINIAVAVYNNKEFKAISGSNNVTNYCISQNMEDVVFESLKVNKLGEVGVGYNRAYDSEKKILEEIHKQIEANILKDEGPLIIYSKWEPCPSCCFVISQFCKMYPNIKVEVKYIKKY